MSNDTKNEEVLDITQHSDINDAFDTIAFAEEHLSTNGFKEGFKRGKTIGDFEGYHLGYHRGAELGAEIGFYKGFLEALVRTVDDEILLQHSIVEKFCRLIERFPAFNDEEIDVISLRDQIRSTYKRLCSFLKIPSDLPVDSVLEF